MTATPATALPCARCGYDLRAQPPAGVCPECGAMVAEAIALRDRPPLAVAAPFAARCFAIGSGLMLLGGLVQWAHWLGISQSWPVWAWRGFLETGWLLTYAGAFFLLARLPDEGRHRRFAALLLGAMSLHYAVVAAWEIGYTSEGFPPWLDWLLDDRVSVGFVWLTVLPVTLFVWLRLARAAGRLKARGLAWVCRGVAAGAVLALVDPAWGLLKSGFYRGGGGTPVLVHPFVMGGLVRSIRGEASVRGSPLGYVEIAWENHWLISLLATPLAYAAMAWATVALTRAAWRSRQLSDVGAAATTDP